MPPIRSLATKPRKEAGRKGPLWGRSHRPGDTACAFVPLNSRSFVFCPPLVSSPVKCLLWKVSVRLFVSLFGISSKPTPGGFSPWCSFGFVRALSLVCCPVKMTVAWVPWRRHRTSRALGMAFTWFRHSFICRRNEFSMKHTETTASTDLISPTTITVLP